MRQSAPTLLLTTVGLLLTGELLDHVSVSAQLRGTGRSSFTHPTAMESHAGHQRTHHDYPCHSEPER